MRTAGTRLWPLFTAAVWTIAIAAWALPGARDEDDAEHWDLAHPQPAVELSPVEVEGWADLSCAQCHRAVVQEWSRTAHALAWQDEAYKEVLAERKRPQLCYGCHVPEPLLVGEFKGRPKARVEDRHHGVSCISCHLGPGGEMLGKSGGSSSAHATARSEMFTGEGSNRLCSACHSTSIGPVVGIAKDFHKSGQAERGRSCVGCHMQQVERAPAQQSGNTTPAAARTVFSHALQTPRDPAFLRRAFAVRYEVEKGATVVLIENRAGHRVPGLIGRELRFTATVVDAAGKSLGVGKLTIDARRYLPVDGRLEIRIPAVGVRVQLSAMHHDPRSDIPIAFLSETLTPDER